MIPYGTASSDDPEPIFPWVNIGLIVACFLVFFYELTLDAEGGSVLNNFLNGYSLVPCEYTGHCAVYAGTPNPFLDHSLHLHVFARRPGAPALQPRLRGKLIVSSSSMPSATMWTCFTEERSVWDQAA